MGNADEPIPAGEEEARSPLSPWSSSPPPRGQHYREAHPDAPHPDVVDSANILCRISGYLRSL
ncbi:hypothetical protein EIP91_001015 [Steccherinum ochraceum]|uniref:Uncharacterized protein n=1 Tax=Steccherinum ochraceum TaxID=92696 RepID=A0A4R0RHY1_9APHY|nr:hypothetical protein EIP91_001015 [Steccherinum ochraceum]